MLRLIYLLFLILFSFQTVAHAYWIWTPKSKKWTNPNSSVKDSPKEQFVWAKTFFENRELKRAYKEFLKLVREYPKSSYAPEALYYTGECLLKMKKYYDAFLQYQKMIEKYPGAKRLNDVIAKQMQIGNYFFHRKDYKIAGKSIPRSYDYPIEVYRQVLKNAPYSKYADHAQFYLAESYRISSKFDEAIQAYEALVEAFPESPYVAESRYKIALSSSGSSLEYAYTDKERDKAIKNFEEYMVQNNQMPRVNLARKEMKELKRKDAEKLYGIARQYDKRKIYKASLFYYQDFYKKYPNSDMAETAQKRIEVLQDMVLSIK
jgi:TolA-binding protein